jgi:hypothetical protein
MQAVTEHLFSPDYQEPPDTSTQVDRLPGTPDAPCLCGQPECRFPFAPGRNA